MIRTKNKASLPQEEVEKLVSKANATIEKIEQKLPYFLEKENKLRAKIFREPVTSVSRVDKLPKFEESKKVSTKLLSNSYQYAYLKVKSKALKVYIETLEKTSNKFKADDDYQRTILTTKNILDDFYNDYVVSFLNKEIKVNQHRVTKNKEKAYLRIKKHLSSYKEKLETISNKVVTALSLKSVSDIPEIRDIVFDPSDIEAKYDINTTDDDESDSYRLANKDYVRDIRKRQLEIYRKINLLLKYYKVKANVDATTLMIDLIESKKVDKPIIAINNAESKYDSALCEPNYQFSQVVKSIKLYNLNIKLKLGNSNFDKKISAKEAIKTPFTEKDINKVETKLSKIDKKIATIESQIAKSKDVDDAYYAKQYKIKSLNETKAELQLSLESYKDNINPVDTKRVKKVQEDKSKFNKKMDTAIKNSGSTSSHILTRLLGLLKNYKLTLSLLIISILCATLFQIAAPVLMNKVFSKENLPNFFTNQFSLDNPASYLEPLRLDYAYLFSTFGLFIAIYFGNFLFNFLIEIFTAKLGGVISYSLRSKVKAKIDRLPLKYFDNTQVGDILSRVSNDVDTISGNIQSVISQSFKGVTLFIGVSLAMLIIRWELALIALATIPFALVVVFLVVIKSQKEFVKAQRLLGNLNGQVEEVYSGIRIVKLFNQEDNMYAKFSVENSGLQKATRKAQFLSGCIQPLLNMVHNIGYVFVCVVGGILQQVNAVVSFMIFLNIFQQPIQQIAQISSLIQQTLAAGNRVFEILDSKEEVEDKDDAKVVDKVDGEVVFDHVAFSYNKDKPLITDLNLVVHKGDSIAIVGPTGAGKTTLVNLIMRFYDINSGKLTIDGTSISDYQRGSIRTKIGMVLQDTWLFSGTIKENIAYGKKDATDEEIIEASKKARAHHFISTLDHGYDTIINEEGGNISQGQKQLITIARAILANPNIMILDEATSSVDTRLEKNLQDAMNETMKGRTSFVIAHRLSTIKNSKLILVMNKGDILEQGTHAELLAKNGFYASLYNSQFLGATNDTTSFDS